MLSDPADVAKDLNNCKAVVVSASAPQPILDAFMEHFDQNARSSTEIPFVLVADYCGTNDRKKQLILNILEEFVPTVISGRLGDIYSVAQRVIEKSEFCGEKSYTGHSLYSGPPLQIQTVRDPIGQNKNKAASFHSKSLHQQCITENTVK